MNTMTAQFSRATITELPPATRISLRLADRDAAAAALAADPRVDRFDAEVSHFESLHPHDAVARVSR